MQTLTNYTHTGTTYTPTHTHGNCYSINTTIQTEFGSVKILLTKMFLAVWSLTAVTGRGSGRESVGALYVKRS